jgi:hypothetical protein
MLIPVVKASAIEPVTPARFKSCSCAEAHGTAANLSRVTVPMIPVVVIVAVAIVRLHGAAPVVTVRVGKRERRKRK